MKPAIPLYSKSGGEPTPCLTWPQATEATPKWVCFVQIIYCWETLTKENEPGNQDRASFWE